MVLQVVDYYKEACRALENSETASMLGKIQKDWKKLVQMKIYYFASIAHVSLTGESVCVCVVIQCMYERVCVLAFDYLMTVLFFLSQQLHMGKQAEEQQKYGERVGAQFTHRIVFPPLSECCGFGLFVVHCWLLHCSQTEMNSLSGNL